MAKEPDMSHHSQGRPKLHVGICGGGLGGLTAAIAIARTGAKVTVLEAASELGEIGAGIQMTPNVSRFLVKWGVSDIIGPDLVQCDNVNMRSADGRIIAYTNFKKVTRDYGYPWWVVRRDHLHAGLAESARQHGATLVIDARVTQISYQNANHPVSVTTEKGAEYEFDLLIGADGLKSVVRQILFPHVKPRAPTKNAAYRAVIPYKEIFEKIPEAKDVFKNAIDVWGSPDSYCITYPMSAGRDFNMVLSHHAKKYVEDVEEADMNELHGFFKDYDPIVKKIISLVPQSRRWPLMIIDPIPSWSSPAKNVVLMGDAIHIMVNHMAQGAATAMEDGAFLGQCISEVIRGVISIPEAVMIYEKTRMPRVWTKQQASFTAGEMYMVPSNFGMARIESSIPEVEGLNNNVATPSPPPPPPNYRSWNLWGYPDSVIGVYTYDAEGDADNAVCEYLQSRGDVNSATSVARRLREKWWTWRSIEAQASRRPYKSNL